MNLGRCIANLLRRYPEVGVPGIGIFKMTHVPASFDREQSAFIPPNRHIEFVAGGTGGFPITDYLQAQGQVDEATAADVLDGAVQELLDTIARNGEALLDSVGYLVAEGASLVFRPFNAEDFGSLKPVKELSLQETAEDTVEVAAYETADDETSGRHAAKWIIAAILLALLVAIGLAWYYQPAWLGGERISQFFGKTTNGEKGQHADEPSGQLIPMEATVADSAAVDSVALSNPEADTVSTAHIAAETVPQRPSVTYEIVVGSFATMRQAEKYVADMKAKGYDLEVVDSRMPGNRKKISWGSFNTEEEAYRELARVQKTFEPSAWIAKVERD